MSRCIWSTWILLSLGLMSCSNGGGGDDFVPGDPNTPAPPAITSVSPAVGPVTGGTRVTVRGSNFIGTVSVALGSGGVSDLEVLSTSILSFTVPAGPLGFAEIVVDSDTGTSITVPPLGFTRLDEVWTSLPPSGLTPLARSFGKMLYDRTRRRMLLFGGEAFDSLTFATTYFGDVWALDLTASTITTSSWILLTPDSGTSGIGSFAEMAVVYDSLRDRFLLTEGYDNCPPFPTPCVLISSAVFALSFSSTSVTDSGTWTRITDTGVDIPPDRITPGSAYDPVNDRLVLFGGFDPIGFVGTNGAGEFNDTWAFNLTGSSSGFW
ncbi:MAG: IPT/TIG domain-containing protein, partial [Planctomycetota bacterium]